MASTDEIVLAVSAVVGFIACLGLGIVLIWYYVNQARAFRAYRQTHDFQTLTGHVRRIGARTAVTLVLLSFVASGACMVGFIPVDSPKAIVFAVIFGIGLSLLLVANILVHAGRVHILRWVVRLWRRRQSRTEENGGSEQGTGTRNR